MIGFRIVNLEIKSFYNSVGCRYCRSIYTFHRELLVHNLIITLQHLNVFLIITFRHGLIELKQRQIHINAIQIFCDILLGA